MNGKTPYAPDLRDDKGDLVLSRVIRAAIRMQVADSRHAVRTPSQISLSLRTTSAV